MARLGRIRKRLAHEAKIMTLLKEHANQAITGLLETLDEESAALIGGVIEKHREALYKGLFYKGRYEIDFVPDKPPEEDYLAQLVFMAIKGATPQQQVIRVGIRGKTPDGEWGAARKKDFPFTYNRPQGH